MANRVHSFKHKFLHWYYCDKCGLVQLKNAATRKEAGKPCKGSE